MAFDFEVISERAEQMYRAWRIRPGIRGQMTRVEDGVDYWYAVAAYEIGKAEKDD